MAPVDPIDPASVAGAFAYEHTDVPPGQTLAEWRRERTQRARAADVARRAARRRRVRGLVALWRPAIPRRVETPRPAQAAR